jgi:tRNA (guanine37-N1)-methyltransferase
MRIDVISIFPEFVAALAATGVVGRAQVRGLLEVAGWNLRDEATDNYRTIDDRPYGGGPGMVMTLGPLRRTIARARAAHAAAVPVIYLSPQGARLTQDRVSALAKLPGMVLLCGRYEGIDERLIGREVDEELSIGDYVLSGGELAAAVVIDAVGRLLEGALGNAQSASQDSFGDGLLDCPHYTRPERDEAGDVPAVLMSGDHAAIARWRMKQKLGRTWLRRPDLLMRMQLDRAQEKLLEEFRREYRQAGGDAG